MERIALGLKASERAKEAERRLIIRLGNPMQTGSSLVAPSPSPRPLVESQRDSTKWRRRRQTADGSFIYQSVVYRLIEALATSQVPAANAAAANRRDRLPFILISCYSRLAPTGKCELFGCAPIIIFAAHGQMVGLIGISSGC